MSRPGAAMESVVDLEDGAVVVSPGSDSSTIATQMAGGRHS